MVNLLPFISHLPNHPTSHNVNPPLARSQPQTSISPNTAAKTTIVLLVASTLNSIKANLVPGNMFVIIAAKPLMSHPIAPQTRVFHLPHPTTSDYPQQLVNPSLCLPQRLKLLGLFSNPSLQQSLHTSPPQSHLPISLKPQFLPPTRLSHPIPQSLLIPKTVPLPRSQPHYPLYPIPVPIHLHYTQSSPLAIHPYYPPSLSTPTAFAIISAIIPTPHSPSSSPISVNSAFA